MYNPSRFFVIVLFIVANGVLAVTSLLAGEFPLGVGAMLCLMPCFLRELDLRKGKRPRKLGRFEWSLIVAGALWVFSAYPVVYWQIWRSPR